MENDRDKRCTRACCGERGLEAPRAPTDLATAATAGALQQQAAGLLLLLLGRLDRVLLAPLVDHAHELEEDLLDVGVGLGRRLQEAAAELGSEVAAHLGRDLALVLQIQLVAHKHDGDL